jgi:hypothetical protein
MKKLLIAAVVCLLAGCKKDRVCECTITVEATSDEPGYTYSAPPSKTVSTKYKNIKSSDPVLESCVSSDVTEESTYQAYKDNKLTTFNLRKITHNNCQIK